MGVSSTLTLLFEDPFWIGLYGRTDGGAYEVCKITFGAEPKAVRCTISFCSTGTA